RPGGPEPVGLVAEGSAQHAWAEYLPEQRAILFVFGRRVYVLNLRDPQSPRWTYHELGFEAVSGELIYVGAALPLEPPGFNDTLSVGDIRPDSVMRHWKNRDKIGR